jgi:hypothetical protein
MNDTLLDHFLAMQEDEPDHDIGDLQDFTHDDDQDGWRDIVESNRAYESHCQRAAENH